MRQIECVEQVDFSKIYNQVLQIAIAEGNAKVPKRIFVFTYRDFEKASKNNWVRDFKEALDNYRERGYFNVPHLMFWNLNNPIAKPKEIGRPVKNHNVGTKLTGFSNNLLSLFVKGEIDSRTYAGQVHGAFGGIDVLDFKKAFKNNWVLDYKEAWKNYRKRGYATVPPLVFWNLKNPIAETEVIGSPVKNHNAGIIITGFSNNLISLFFKGETDSRTYATRRARVRAVFGIDLQSELRFYSKG
ncbi:PREDICTED: LOW QUALITY PROTEIN [Prunus dulcis]|uniref:PREDICTED: LOW QUALITY PROTEIN n=1 Tax=Prunus dulcis TaxID=3755 RepID=A0A5E4ERN9_PRUDU|nr:PREDICTED: LOW QUALITY PROTEIN [Prunus dulcis]